jgi:predicted RNA-binding protein with PUA-like domain
MKKGDLAFFYHSNTKEPSIVGTMEIVEEHSPDCMPPVLPPLKGVC